MGDPYDPSDEGNEDDCSYCGCPPMYQDPIWDHEVMAPDENQCPQCGALNLYPLQPTTKKEERKTMITESRINSIANILIQAVEVFINPGVESERGLLDAARGLDRDGAAALTNLGKGLLMLSGSAEEGESDAKD